MHTQTPWIQTFTGRAFPLLAPARGDVSIKDIAHSLANQCRFAGHSKRFYSVAEHSLYVSRVLPCRLALVGLLHDAAEAYVQDITRPLKEALPEHKFVEGVVWAAIADRFSLPDELPQEIKTADMRMLATEAEYLMLPPPQPWNIPAKPFELEEIGLNHPRQLCLPPTEAHRRFLERFAELSA